MVLYPQHISDVISKLVVFWLCYFCTRAYFCYYLFYCIHLLLQVYFCELWCIYYKTRYRVFYSTKLSYTPMSDYFRLSTVVCDCCVWLRWCWHCWHGWECYSTGIHRVGPQVHSFIDRTPTVYLLWSVRLV